MINTTRRARTRPIGWTIVRSFAFAGMGVFALSCAPTNSSTSAGYGALAIIDVSATSTALAINTSEQIVAKGFDASDNPLTITPTWAVVNGGGTISSTGVFTAGGTPGTFTNTIKATSGTISGTMTITVTASAPATSRVGGPGTR